MKRRPQLYYFRFRTRDGLINAAYVAPKALNWWLRDAVKCQRTVLSVCRRKDWRAA
jgi:hypothetical protein